MMGALMDHAAVLWMSALMAWPVTLALAAVPLVLGALQLRGGQWLSGRRRCAAGWAFVVGLVLGGPLTFALFGGGWGDLRYWLDVAALIGMMCAMALYAALLAYLLAGFRSSQAQR